MEQQMGPSNQSGGNRRFFRLFSKGPETKENGPWVSKFYESIKINGKWGSDLTPDEHGVAGFNSYCFIAKGIAHKTYDDPVHGLKNSVEIHGEDHLGNITIQMGFNHQTYGILNALGNGNGYDKKKPITIEVWARQDPTTKKDFANAKVLNSLKEKVEWRLQQAELPKSEKVTLPSGKEVFDDAGVTKFWIGFIAKLKNAFVAVHGEVASQQPAQQPQSAQQQSHQAQPAATAPNIQVDQSVAANAQQNNSGDWLANGNESDDLPF
jgi:hypothetical protein